MIIDPVMYRYTDEVVRKNYDHFYPIVVDYVFNYVGSFGTVHDMRQRMRRGDFISATHVRMILNVMRADPNVSVLPIPRDVILSQTENTSSHSMINTDRQAQQPQQAQQSQQSQWTRPSHVTLRTKWHYLYGMSLHPKAKTVHKFHVSKCNIVYLPRSTSDFADRFRVHLAWMCGKTVPGFRKRYQGIKMLSAYDAHTIIENNEREWCRGCILRW